MCLGVRVVDQGEPNQVILGALQYVLSETKDLLEHPGGGACVAEF